MHCKTQFRCEGVALMLAFMSMMAVSTLCHVLLRPSLVEKSLSTEVAAPVHSVFVWLAGFAVGALVRWEACKHIGVKSDAQS